MSMEREVFENTLAKIEDEEELDEGGYEALSMLVDERLAAFRALWERLPASRRLDVLEELAEQSEEHAYLDYTPIWQLGLDDAAAPVRALAVECSADEEGQWLIDPLVRLCTADPDSKVRAAAADGLAR